MIFPQLKQLKRDIEQTEHFIRRLEKDGDQDKVPFYKSKLLRLQQAVIKIESLIIHNV